MVGRPKGSSDYEAVSLLPFVGLSPKTTEQVRREFSEKYGYIAWGTVQKHLMELKENGKIKGKKVGKYFVWEK